MNESIPFGELWVTHRTEQAEGGKKKPTSVLWEASQDRRVRPPQEGTEVQMTKSRHGKVQSCGWFPEDRSGCSHILEEAVMNAEIVDDSPCRLGWRWSVKEDPEAGAHERFQVSAKKGWTPVSAENWNRNPKPRRKA